MRTLFKKVMEGEWLEVIFDYAYKESHLDKITSSGDTALHVATANNLEKVVHELIVAITRTSEGSSERLKKALEIKNKEGNTPLHIAASLGNVSMCEVMLKSGDKPDILKNLVEIENNKGETPLFLAVQMGNKEAFLCLLSISGINGSQLECFNRDDGNNILHCAITSESFDLAYLIIHLSEDLVDRFNIIGDTPLKILARKRSAFESGSKLGRLDKIIYSCIFVNPLKIDDPFIKTTSSNNGTHGNTSQQNHYAWVKYCIVFLRKCFHLSEQEHGPAQADLEKSEAGHTARRTENNENNTNNDNSFKSVLKRIMHTAIMFVSRLGSARVRKIIEEKKKHTWSRQVLKKLVNHSHMYASDGGGWYYNYEGGDELDKVDFESDDAFFFRKDWTPETVSTLATKMVSTMVKKTVSTLVEKKVLPRIPSSSEKTVKKKDSAILIATRNGITEVMEEILNKFPVAMHDVDTNDKNIVLLAVETRQLKVYKLLLDYSKPYDPFVQSHHDLVHVNDNAFRKVDSDGNSALHLAAKLRDNHEPWPIPGDALQMQWEIKWHKFVENSMPPNFFVRYNKEGKTPEEIFTESHKGLVKAGGEWLKSTAESCSVVAALIATVAFATSTAIPGGTEHGKPTLEDKFAFKMFAITSLIALCFSVSSLSMFLSILTSRYQEKDFGRSLPWKLLVGLTSLFVSVASILVSFCSGHFFVLGESLKFAAFPVYAFTCLPISFFAVAQFPLYIDLFQATFRSPFAKASRAYASKESIKI